MIINHNIRALNTYRQLSINEANQSKSMAKLSSGLRINSAADDAAGLSISEKMKGQMRGLEQASRNAQDGISMIQTAEGALSETQDILQRMRELATQASNGTLTDQDRQAVQAETNQLTSEINRIGNTTQFNTQNLLKGTNQAPTTTAAQNNTLTQGQTGVAAGAISPLSILASSVKGVVSTTSVQGQTSQATGAVGSFLVTQNSIQGQKASATISDGLTFTANSTGTTLNGTNISVAQATGTSTASSLAYNSTNNTWTFSIGTDANGNSLATNQGTLYNEVSSALTAYNTANPSSQAQFTVNVPTNTAAALPSSIVTTGTFGGGVQEQDGQSQFTVTTAFKEAGDTVTVGGKTFTAVTSGANGANGQFNINAKASYIDSTSSVAANTNVSGAAPGDNITITVGATSYSVNQAALVAYGGAGKTNSDLVNLINNAVDGSGNKLSSVADVSINNGKLEIVAKTAAAGTDVTANVTGAAVATLTGFAVGATATTQAGANSGANAADQARSLRVAIDSVLGTQYSASGSATAGQIILTENPNQASGVNLTAPTVAGSGTNNLLNISNTGGQNLNTVTIVQGSTAAGAAAASGKVDTSFQLTAANKNTELNGVSVKFSGLTNTASGNSFTTTWDSTTRTLTVSGNIQNNVANTAATIATAIGTAVTTGLTNAGYANAGAITGTAGATAGNGAAILTNFNGKTITFGDTANGGTAGATAVTNDTLTVDENNGNLTIYLANSTAAKNSASNIQAAIQALGNVNGHDYTKYTTSSTGNWDTTETGSDINHATGTLVGGTVAVNGSYSTTLTQPFAAGDTVTIKGQTFTAVASGADATKGQFNIGNGTVTSQAASLANAINLNSVLGKTYQATTNGATLNLTENTASGTDLKTTDVGVAATGVQGQYSASVNQLLTDGGSISIDGQQIRISSKTADVGYSNGTAIQQATTLTQQNQALANAINTNSNLSGKYTASVDNNGNLLLNQKIGSSSAPQVSMTTSNKGDFTSTFQIGANAGQSMSIDIKDMRSEALGIAGDGTTTTVQATDGKVASFVAVANVTDGTNNTNTQFSLDLSTSDKATAAISVLDDAINAVSAQRSALGAYQNRLDHTINNLNTTDQNITDAQSRIADVDMAKEMMDQTKFSVLAQASQAMLAQANQQPQQVLQLLRG